MIQELREYAGLCVKACLQLFSRGPSSSSQLFSVRQTLGREKSGLQFGFSLGFVRVQVFGSWSCPICPSGAVKRATYGKGLGFVQVKATAAVGRL